MKNILLTLVMLGSYHAALAITDTSRFSISIWDYDFSMAYNVFYSISNDSLTVKYMGGLVGEGETTLIKRALKQNEQKSIIDFFSSLNIDTLKPTYTNPLIADGDQKQIVIKLESHPVKTVTIANFHQPDVDYYLLL